MLAILGIGGGFAMGGLSVGIGVFFLPALIQLDVHPTVATQTAHFISAIAGIAASIIVVIMERLNYEFAVLAIVFSIIGSLPGIHYQQWILELSKGRTQYGILILFIVLIILVFAIPPIALMIISHKHLEGQDLISLR